MIRRIVIASSVFGVAGFLHSNAGEVVKDILQAMSLQLPLKGSSITGESPAYEAPVVAKVESTLDPKLRQEDPVRYYAERYSPIIYLHPEEIAWPIDPKDYFEHPKTRILVKSTGQVKLHPPLTLEGIDIFVKMMKGNNDFMVDVDRSVLRGAVPLKDGIIRTPLYYYAFYSEDKTKLYFQYLFFYGYNAPYPLQFGPLLFAVDDKYDIQNAHEADLEHITMQVDVATGEVDRIFFAAHGSAEGAWVQKSVVQWSSGQSPSGVPAGHPIVYSARFSHASYWKEGIWVRVFGMANDYTAKGRVWVPEVRRLLRGAPFTNSSGVDVEDGYDPATMSWAIFCGEYGIRGVNSMRFQSWAGRPDNSSRTPEKPDVLYCVPNDTGCAERLAPQAMPPGEDAAWAHTVRKVLQFRLRALSALTNAYRQTISGLQTAGEAVVSVGRSAGRAIESGAREEGNQFRRLFRF